MTSNLEWRHLGLSLLAEKGIDESRYRDEVIKGRLLESLGRVYWQALVSRASRLGLSIDDIGKRLGVHRGTYNRWDKGEFLPGLDKFTGALVIAVREEIGQIGFPTTVQARSIAATQTMALIRANECGTKDGRTPTADEFALVWIFMRHPGVDEQFSGHWIPDDPRVMGTINAVIRKLNSIRPHHAIRSAAIAQRSIFEWINPYALFQIGLREDWRGFDELPV